jgi:hypothetical protein
MPAFVKTKEDERLWDKAKGLAAEQGHKEDWAYVTGIYKQMKGGKVAADPLRVVFNHRLAKLPEKARKEVLDLLAGAKGKPLEDDKVHALADKLKMSPHDLESEIYAYASLWAINELAQVNPGGRAEAKGVKPSDFDPKEIAKGIKVEMEHTKDKALAKKIVVDHLAENSKYYEALAKMESEFEQ